MLSKVLNVAALALAASTVVSAQTFTLCDPTKKDCPPDPALGTSVDIDLTKGANKDIIAPLAGTVATYDPAKGEVLSIKAETDAPTFASHGFIFFGRIDVTLQAAPGKGIVTSLVLQSDDLDEIDFEWVGGDNAQVQTNYFSKGDTTTYDRGAYHPVANPTGQFHTYSIDWTKERVQWIIDGAVIRTLTYADAKGGATFPQTPMQFKYGTWVAGKKTASEGTVQWSGGYTNFAEAPFDAYYKDIKITDYSNGVKGAKQYVYGDKTGKWESIKVITEGGADTKSSTSSAPASSTTSAPSSKTTLSTSTVSGAATTTSASGTAPTGSRTTTSSGPSSQTSAPGTNAAGHVTFGFGNIAIAGVALLVANLFVL